MNDPNWLDRLKDEYLDLSEKIRRLNLFLKSDDYKELATNDCALLFIQSSAMTTYGNVLFSRLMMHDPEWTIANRSGSPQGTEQ